MSDVSKTNELIAEAREQAEVVDWFTPPAAAVMRELADALESATRVPVPGEPNAKRLFADFKPSCSCMSSFDGEGDGACAVHREGERTVNANCMTDADGCEAGTEEPNDDPETHDAPEVSDRERVEVVARKLAGEDRGYDFYEYPINHRDRERYRADARIIIEALNDLERTQNAQRA